MYVFGNCIVCFFNYYPLISRSWSLRTEASLAWWLCMRISRQPNGGRPGGRGLRLWVYLIWKTLLVSLSFLTCPIPNSSVPDSTIPHSFKYFQYCPSITRTTCATQQILYPRSVWLEGFTCKIDSSAPEIATISFILSTCYTTKRTILWIWHTICTNMTWLKHIGQFLSKDIFTQNVLKLWYYLFRKNCNCIKWLKHIGQFFNCIKCFCQMFLHKMF